MSQTLKVVVEQKEEKSTKEEVIIHKPITKINYDESTRKKRVSTVLNNFEGMACITKIN